MSEDFDEILDLATDEELKALEGESETEGAEEGQGEPETEQDRADSEPEMDAGADETPEEGSDAGESEPEAVEAKSDSEIDQLMAKLEAMEKSNSGLYRELKEERAQRQEESKRRQDLLDEIKQKAEDEEADKRKSEVPDKDEDPAGYLEAQIKTLREEQSAWRRQQEEAAQQQAQAQAYQQAEHTVGQLEEQFRQQNQDYDEALNFARNERARLLRATHPDQPDEWVGNMIAQGDRMFALQSLQQGVDPAQRAYDYAIRLGYKAGEGSGNTGQAAPAAAPAQANPPAQQAKPRAKPKTTSLSAAAGRSGGKGQKITRDQFANLDIDNDDDRELFDRIAGNESLARQIEEQGYVNL